MKKQTKRPSGEISIYDPRGYAYLPKDLRKEVGVEGKGKVEYFKDANCVLLVRRGASKEEVLKGLGILRDDLDLRWVEPRPRSDQGSEQV